MRFMPCPCKSLSSQLLIGVVRKLYWESLNIRIADCRSFMVAGSTRSTVSHRCAEHSRDSAEAKMSVSTGTTTTTGPTVWIICSR